MYNVHISTAFVFTDTDMFYILILGILCKKEFKDIVQPKKRGVKRGTIRYVLTSYTIADIF